MESLAPELVKLVEIVWINIVLSGDNAVVIAMACRGLPPERQRYGMVLGALVAVVLRIVFTLAVATLLATPFLKIVGACLLFWIAVKLPNGSEQEADARGGGGSLWQAVRMIAVADAVMSLDNVLAMAAIAKGSMLLLVFGLAISVPLIVAGASIVMAVLTRLPILVWAGAALLGFVAGDMMVSDPWLESMFDSGLIGRLELPAAIVGAVFVVALGWFLARRPARAEPDGQGA